MAKVSKSLKNYEKGGQATTAFWKPAKKSATSKRRRGKKGQQALPQAALNPAASLTFAVFFGNFLWLWALGTTSGRTVPLAGSAMGYIFGGAV